MTRNLKSGPKAGVKTGVSDAGMDHHSIENCSNEEPTEFSRSQNRQEHGRALEREGDFGPGGGKRGRTINTA